LNIKLSQRIIQDICGTVSFKKGGSFYHAGKVSINHLTADTCQATVTGVADFHVIINKDEKGGILPSCSCPKLETYNKDCQHVAAVLLAIHDIQRHGNIPTMEDGQHGYISEGHALTEGLLNLFNKDKRAAKSSRKMHFEDRMELDAEFICRPIQIGKGFHLFGIKMKIGKVNIQDIREFLERVNRGTPYKISNSFTYDPNQHCFMHENDAVIQQLLLLNQVEKTYLDSIMEQSDTNGDMSTLLIPPTSWDILVPVLQKAPSVRIEYTPSRFTEFRFSKDPLSLMFDFAEKGNDYRLKISGMNNMILFGAYQSVLNKGKLIQMKNEDYTHLSELKRMLNVSGTNEIPVPSGHLEEFLEKVMPGLRKLGDVHVTEDISRHFMKTPLIAKLYLDRVGNRLLAGLEFHYGHLVINPLEISEVSTNSKIVRDTDKEDSILQLMDAGMFAKTDGGYFLHNEDLEYEFLTYIVPKLQNMSQIYATTAVRNRIFRESAKPRIRVKIVTERTNWLEFKFEMDGIPDKEIREVLSALEEKRKYYRLRNGALLSLETREFEEINRFLSSPPVQIEDLESGLNFPVAKGLNLLNSLDEHAVEFEDSFVQFMERLNNPDFSDIEVPETLHSVMREYQKTGYKWLKTLAHYGFGGILADDMGLGKTLQSIAYIRSEVQTIRSLKRPALVVCPSSLSYNWLSEFIKFTPELHISVVDGSKKARSLIMKDCMEGDVVIISYPLLRKEIAWFEKRFFHTVFFDEAQAFKNPTTQTARAVKKLQATNHFALTGTPVENSLEELWSIFHVVFPELFQGLQEYSNLTKKTIARRIKPFLLRRMKEDVLAELPEKLESIETADLLPEQKKLYAAYLAKLRHDTLKHLNKENLSKNRIKILAGMTRLRQICCHPALFVEGYKGSSAKYEQLMQIIEESRLSGRRLLIFSQFTKMLNLIGKDLAFEGIPFFYLDGNTPSIERLEYCNRFNEGENDVFLISLKAGGTGLNLTGADTVILYDNWWNPAVEEQAADRAHRIGQTNVVQVIKLIARGTIEEKMNELQDKKKLLVDEIIDSEGKVISTFTEEDIREILMI